MVELEKDLGSIKRTAIDIRRAYGRAMNRISCKCDVCDKMATDMHHIIPKSYTAKGSDNRGYSEHLFLFSMLCVDCHSKAHNPKMTEMLIRRNFDFFGKDKVISQLDKISKSILIMSGADDARY